MLHADWALLPDGFAANVTVAVHDGIIADVITGSPRARDAEHLSGVLLPGIANLHSHAFQRVFAGMTAHTGGGGDFWSWRTAMYQAAARMTPELYAPVTAYLGKELLKGGYTAFAEFHYLHHQPNGKPYADRTAMAEAIYAGAAQAGIGLTLLVALYETGGFGGAPLAPAQQRFRGSSDTALAMVQDLAARHTGTIGLALHSLRAVPPETLRNAVTTLSASNPAAPIHIHIAEQTAEVEACIAALGAPPIAWLLENAPVDHRWCLVHATHATAAELTAAAQTPQAKCACSSGASAWACGAVTSPPRRPHHVAAPCGRRPPSGAPEPAASAPAALRPARAPISWWWTRHPKRNMPGRISFWTRQFLRRPRPCVTSWPMDTGWCAIAGTATKRT
jgi:formimidoylglutamate deiminase